MRLRKRTKKRIAQVMAVLLCLMMLLPIVSYFLPADPATESQLMLMNELAKANEHEHDHDDEHDHGHETDRTISPDDVPEDWVGPYEVVGVDAADRLHIALKDDEFVYVNLLGIKAPHLLETEDEKELEAGNRAYEHARDLIFEHQVYLKYEKNTDIKSNDADVLVYLDNGDLLNERLIRDGFAKVSPTVSDEHKDAFQTAQDDAESEKSGLWKDYWKKK